MNVLASNTELLKPMTKEELADLKKGIKGYLALFSKEWDILTFAEGKLANEFCRILDKEGSDAARRHAISRLVAFRGRYGRGLEISEGWSKVAKALYENSNYAEIEQKAASDHH